MVEDAGGGGGLDKLSLAKDQMKLQDDDRLD